MQKIKEKELTLARGPIGHANQGKKGSVPNQNLRKSDQRSNQVVVNSSTRHQEFKSRFRSFGTDGYSKIWIDGRCPEKQDRTPVEGVQMTSRSTTKPESHKCELQ